MDYKFNFELCNSEEYDTFIKTDDGTYKVIDSKEVHTLFGPMYSFTFIYKEQKITTQWLQKHICDRIIIHKEKVSQKSNKDDSELCYLITDSATYLGTQIHNIFIGYNVKTSDMFAKEITSSDNIVSQIVYDTYFHKYVLYKNRLYFVESFKNNTPISYISGDVDSTHISESARDGYLLSFVNDPQAHFVTLTNPFSNQRLFDFIFQPPF